MPLDQVKIEINQLSKQLRWPQKNELGKPRNPISGYNFFCKEQMKVLKYTEGLVNIKAILRCAEIWKTVPEHQRQIYNDMAAADKERFRRQQIEYNTTGTFTDEMSGMTMAPISG